MQWFLDCLQCARHYVCELCAATILGKFRGYDFWNVSTSVGDVLGQYGVAQRSFAVRL